MHRGWWTSLLLISSGCAEWQADRDGFSEQDRALITAMQITTDDKPVDPSNDVWDDVAARTLGQALFFDPELSGKLRAQLPGQVSLGNTDAPGRIACVDCHEPTGFFDDQRTAPNNVSLGISFLARNSPSLVNVAFYRQFAWDGRSDSLWMQCAVAHESAGATGGTRLRLARRIAARYQDAYVRAFSAFAGDAGFDAGFGELDRGDGGETRFDEADGGEKTLTGAEARLVNRIASNGYKAMAAYLSQLISIRAPIDQYAANVDALTPAAKRGLKLFLGKAGCVECHTGKHFTDNQYHSIGVGQRGANAPPTDLGRFTGLTEQSSGRQSIFNRCGPYAFNVIDGADAGRAAADAGAPGCPGPTDADRGLFRTKSLRNVARTAPYMHAGQLQTLEDVVRFYNAGGESADFTGKKSPMVVPLGLSDTEVQDLVAFLEALSGEPLPARLTCDSSVREPVPAGGTSAHRFPKCEGTP